ncbi:DUF3168 domain-containing protein [Breoghania sp. L-A4]|uniref:DUF3168 domain-containing protein n=1 Tax=Breoghania sp. L-A4 TaxID=2304600 RepID=UPI000E358758|nr:DUF3168 domain-containing protein [Breoghania sp. L-A4]AXS39963.1 DUF3168 domain-containing protein [Breoghania sp. L-A4]
MSHPALELQGVLVAALRADDTLIAMLSPDGVRDGAARGARFPYVEIGTWDDRDVGAQGWAGRDHRFEILVWSRAGGRSEALRIMERVGVIAEGISADIGAFRLVNLVRLADRVSRWRDGRSWRGVVVFRALTEPHN